MRKFILFFLSGFILDNGNAQNTIGLPDILNYSKQYYKAGAQNRKIRQDKKGVLYFANSEGLMSFDGINWKIYPLPNKSIVRSIEFGPDNKLYVGGQDEFGYFSPDSKGQLVYHSLKHLLPAGEQSFTDVWEIYFHRGLIFFQTSNNIYQVSGKHSTVYKGTHWRFMTVCNNLLIAQDYNKGLLIYQNGVWAPFLETNGLPTDFFATSMTSIGRDSAILTTEKNGVYLLTGNDIRPMRSPFLDKVAGMHLSSSTMVNKDHIAITTNLDGCYIIDKQGNLIQKFSINEGLQNNNIRDIFMDKEKNLWLGLENGVDFIAYSNAIKHIYPDYLNEGSGYASSIYNNELYIGTSNGLYKAPLTHERDLSFVKSFFQPVANTQGQVWNLSQVNGKLMMGHHDGAFMINGNTASVIDNSTGFWTFLPFYNVLPSSVMIAGTYNGINFYDFANGNFTSKKMMAHFESARFVCMDNNNIWVSHPYKGIYRVQLLNGTPDTKFYTLPKGIQSANGNYLFRIKNQIILTTEHGIFEYNEAKDSFEPSAFYNTIFGEKDIRYLKEDESGNIWFVFDKILGVLDMSATQPLLIYFPELTNKFVSGFEHIYPVNKNNIFIGGERGFYHINFEQYKTIRYPLVAQITSVKTINKKDSLLFGGYVAHANEDPKAVLTKRTTVNHALNSFRFEYASPVYAQQANIEYSYFLEGFDEKWSEFSRRTEKEYTNLPAGDYTFFVKVRNNLGNESEQVGFCFSVLPPWYLSIWAYIVYGCIIMLGVYGLYRYQKNKFRNQQIKHEEEQKRLQYLHQLEMEKTDKEIVKLKNEKLEAEIQHKNTELASVAMHLVQKGEMLAKIKEQIEHLKKQSGDVKNSDDFKKITRALSEEEKIDQQWEQFAKHFDNVHSDFLSTLKSKYPVLSANELKLSAYLRMNLSTKEIAQLMNISIRGVEISRYRLRKKLAIPTETNLYNFLIEL